jgi:hypothetical protein
VTEALAVFTLTLNLLVTLPHMTQLPTPVQYSTRLIALPVRNGSLRTNFHDFLFTLKLAYFEETKGKKVGRKEGRKGAAGQRRMLKTSSFLFLSLCKLV